MKRQLFSWFVLLLVATSCSSRNETDTTAQPDPYKIHIATSALPASFDPGQARSLASTTTLRMIYEGLLRKAPDGSLVPGIAERWEVSADGLLYRFYLREAYWSNGEPVTAEDFVFAWKRQLDPDFPAPNAFQLFSIGGAREAKEGSAPLSQITVRAHSPKQLDVELAEPSATFLELTTFHALFPLCSSHCATHPQWTDEGWKGVVANGPFTPDSESSFSRNSNYWDQSAVQIAGIELHETDDQTAILLFEQGELDWVGSPLGTLPADAVNDLKRQGALRTAPAAGTQFLRFNTAQGALGNKKVRKALSWCIDRDAICDKVLRAGQSPATSLVPPFVANVDRASRSLFSDGAVVAAREQLQSSGRQLDTIILTYSNSDRYHRIAQVLQQQWQSTLGIQVELERTEPKVLFQRLSQKDYQVALGSWFADIDDPINFLEVFERANNGTNNTGWENPRYQELLASARTETDESHRTILLQQAEDLLMDEMPIAPINTFTYAYLQSSDLEGVIFAPLGYLDFKYARRTTRR